MAPGRHRGEIRRRLKRRGVFLAVQELEDIGHGFKVEPIGPAAWAQASPCAVCRAMRITSPAAVTTSSASTFSRIVP